MLRKRIKGTLVMLATLGGLVLTGCAPQAKIAVYTPAEIDTKGIKKVAIGRFEVAEVYEKINIERDGNWRTKVVSLSAAQKELISRQVRAQVVNTISANPYFDLVYTDEFARLEDDAALQKMIAAGGYKTQDVDAVINGKIWIDFEKTDGSDVAKAEMLFVQGGSSKSSVSITTEKIVWWPYKNARGTLILEAKLTRLNPTDILAITADSRSFSQKVGGAPKGLLDSLNDAAGTASELIADSQKEEDNVVEKSGNVLPSFQQVTADLAVSIATNFVRRVAVTRKFKSYPIARGGDSKGALLIEAGAYERAIDILQKETARKAKGDDLYNLGLAFEAVGEYGTAINFYRKALAKDRENLMYAQGLGRVEQMLRERPTLRRQLATK